MSCPRLIHVALVLRDGRSPRAVVEVDGVPRPDATVDVAPSGAVVVIVPAVAPQLTETAGGPRLSDGLRASGGSKDTSQGVLVAPDGPPAPGIGISVPSSDRQEGP